MTASEQYEIDDILKSLGGRTLAGRWGIGTALQYVKSLEQFAASDKALAEIWAKEIRESASRLTYCDAAMADPDFMQKSVRDGADITSGCVLEYDCVLSSRRKDRDGDILEQTGLVIDTKMPLLWQHIQTSPIGKHVKVLSRDENMTKCRFAIADTGLGRDAAVLVKFGALRQSHGFKPHAGKFSPVEIVKGADGRDIVKGWHIKGADVLEGSAVSIPGNSDADPFAVWDGPMAKQLSLTKEFDGICSAFGRDLLKTEVVRQWAKSFYDARPVVAGGVEMPAADRYVFNDKAERWFDRQEKRFVSITKATEVNSGSVVSASVTGELTSKTEKPADTKTVLQAQTDDKTGKCPCGGSYDSVGACPNCGHMREPKKAAAEAVADKSIAAVAVETKQFDAASLETKMLGMDPYLEGSWEWIQWKLATTAGDFLRSKGVDCERWNVYVLATFAGRSILCCSPYDSSDRSCYDVAWSLNAAGVPQWSGEPTEVEVKAQVVAKMMAALVAKSMDAARSVPLENQINQLSRSVVAKSIQNPLADREIASLEKFAGICRDVKSQKEDSELSTLLGL